MPVLAHAEKKVGKEEGMKKWFSETLPEKLTLLDNLLCKEHELYAVGLKVSLADIVLYSFKYN